MGQGFRLGRKSDSLRSCRRSASPPPSTLSLNAFRLLVTGLVSEVRELSAEVAKLRAENAELREENAALRQENTPLKVENQLLRDEIARQKNRPPRPAFRPSGMEKAMDFKLDEPPAAKKKPRGPKLDIKRVSREEILRLCAPPAGSRFKGYKSCHVRDLVISAEVVHYRRECWLTPDGKMLLAPFVSTAAILPIRRCGRILGLTGDSSCIRTMTA